MVWKVCPIIYCNSGFLRYPTQVASDGEPLMHQLLQSQSRTVDRRHPIKLRGKHGIEHLAFSSRMKTISFGDGSDWFLKYKRLKSRVYPVGFGMQQWSWTLCVRPTSKTYPMCLGFSLALMHPYLLNSSTANLTFSIHWQRAQDLLSLHRNLSWQRAQDLLSLHRNLSWQRAQDLVSLHRNLSCRNFLSCLVMLPA